MAHILGSVAKNIFCNIPLLFFCSGHSFIPWSECNKIHAKSFGNINILLKFVLQMVLLLFSLGTTDQVCYMIGVHSPLVLSVDVFWSFGNDKCTYQIVQSIRLTKGKKG